MFKRPEKLAELPKEFDELRREWTFQRLDWMWKDMRVFVIGKTFGRAFVVWEVDEQVVEDWVR